METENENLSSNAHVFHTTIPTGDFASSIGRELLRNVEKLKTHVHFSLTNRGGL